MLAAVLRAVRGTQVEVTLECEVTNGKLLAFLESHTRIHDRQFNDGRAVINTVMGKQTLSDLSRNNQVEIKIVQKLS